MIPYEDFSKIDLRVVKILNAERISGSDKLLKLQVNLGEEGNRQIIAGIGKVYNPETLANKEIIIVSNLETRILLGEESQGMLLAASGENGPVLLVPEKETPPGAKIS
ncbi:MAG: methionine--tRNA ligase subunit beta [Candidatus Paceibacterota bacterium]|jgi:methionyl-tRNA synthetase